MRRASAITTLSGVVTRRTDAEALASRRWISSIAAYQPRTTSTISGRAGDPRAAAAARPRGTADPGGPGQHPIQVPGEILGRASNRRVSAVGAQSTTINSHSRNPPAHATQQGGNLLRTGQ